MATPVPYNPVVTVAPQTQPTPLRQTETPIGAFGGLVAQATSHLGQVQESAGNELFSRALAMQQLNQQAEASEAAANFTTQLGQLHANYTSQLGKAAVDGYQPYVDSVNGLREQIGSNLTSDFARRMYNQESRFMQARAIWAGAGHMAQQNKAYVIGASNARIDASTNQALMMPDDEDTFKAGLQSTQNEIHQQAVLHGWSGDQESLELAKATSKLWSARIQGMSKSQPFAAQKLLDQATQDGSITGQDLASVSDYVNKQKYSVGARMETSNILAGNGNEFGNRQVAMPMAMEAIGGYESHGNYNLVGPETKSMGHGLGKYMVMSANLQPWLKEAGMQPMTEAEFLKNPAAQDQLFKFKFGQYMDEGGTFNAAATRWFTGTYTPAKGVTDATDTTKGHTVTDYLTGTNAILARNASLEDLTNVARQRAQELSPNDPMLGDVMVQRIEALHSNQVRVQRENEFNNRQVVEGALVEGMAGGKLPTTVEDLKTDPKVSIAWDAMTASDQRKYMKVLASNAKGDTAWTDDKLRQFQQLRGMAINDPQSFLQQDVVGMDLPFSARKQLIGMQAQVQKQAGANPAVTHAMQVLSPTLESAGINRKDDKDGYNQFTGAMHDAIEQFMQDNKRPPKDDEIQVMGARLLQKQSTPWMFNPWSSTEMFRMPVPDEAASVIRSDPAWGKLGITPTDDMIQRVYIQKQYQQLYGAKPSKAPQPQVPRSE